MKPSLQASFLLLFLLSLLLVSNLSYSQLVAQDFETLSTVQGWASATNPSRNQVNLIGNSPSAYFELESNSGDRFLRLVKANSQQLNHQAFFLRETNFPAQALLKIQFDVALTAASGVKGVVGSLYVGENLGQTAFFPDNINRFATIDLNFSGGNAFSIANAHGAVQRETSDAYTGEARVTIFLNNSNSSATYLSPGGELISVGAKRLSVWVGEALAIQNAEAQLGSPTVVMKAIKFTSRNNALEGTMSMDNFLVEPLQSLQEKPSLLPAGGVFTVGSGGYFNSLTNKGGVFEALNALQSPVTGAFSFRIVGDLVGETGAVGLKELGGLSATNTISFRPQDNTRTYTISGDNQQDRGTLISLNGTDWVVIDGRAPGDASEGITTPSYLLIRNGGMAPTLQLQNDATNNVVSYTNIQGASSEMHEGVISIGDGSATGNDANTFQFNSIGDMVRSIH